MALVVIDCVPREAFVDLALPTVECVVWGGCLAPELLPPEGIRSDCFLFKGLADRRVDCVVLAEIRDCFLLRDRVELANSALYFFWSCFAN